MRPADVGVQDWIAEEIDRTDRVGEVARCLEMIAGLINADLSDDEIRRSAQMGYLIDTMREDHVA